jgi:pyridoxal phosphate enzyme (YggS family)
MVELIADLDAEMIAANLQRVRGEIVQALERSGNSGREVAVLAATKYVALADMAVLAQAGIHLVGENRAQDLQAKAEAHGDMFEWHFIGQLQSRRVRLIMPQVRMIHSVASESAVSELERRRELAHSDLRILIEVNLAAEPGKDGIAPEQLESFIARAPFPVAGLMTMPPQASDPEESRRWFRALRGLRDEHGLEHLSMGTSQDYLVAVEEGATIVRIGTSLYH